MNVDYDKYADGLVPSVVQDQVSGSVLMLAFMNADAIEKTRSTGQVTFFSRSKGRLWTKGEASGNYLELVSITADCDNDTLLIKAIPHGPTCHLGTDTCFGTNSKTHLDGIRYLESVIEGRRRENSDDSYIANLFRDGINKIAQKVGEEAVELVIEAKDENRGKFVEEAADLLFHYLLLLAAKDVSIEDVLSELESRRR